MLTKQPATNDMMNYPCTAIWFETANTWLLLAKIDTQNACSMPAVGLFAPVYLHATERVAIICVHLMMMRLHGYAAYCEYSESDRA